MRIYIQHMHRHSSQIHSVHTAAHNTALNSKTAVPI